MNAPASDETPVTPTSTDTGPAADGRSPGQRLRAARQARKLEVARIATELRLTPATIEALERDDYASLPSPVFVSGYIRTYARLLGLDPGPLIERFRELHPGAEAPPPLAYKTRPATAPSAGPGLAGVLLGALLLALLAGGAYYLWWAQQPSLPSATQRQPADLGSAPTAAAESDPGPDTPASTPEPIAADLAQLSPRADEAAQAERAGAAEAIGSETFSSGSDADEAADPAAAPETPDSAMAAAGTGPAASTAPTQYDPRTPADGADASPDLAAGSMGERSGDQPSDGAPSPPESSPEDSSPGEPSPDETADSGAAPATGGGTGAHAAVVIDFSGPCWVDIRDASGETLLFGEMGDGDSERLGGTPPYSLVLGNAAAATLTVGGEPFDLDAVARGNVARFDLDPQQPSGEPAATP